MDMVRISGYLLLIVGITVGSLLLVAVLGGAKVPFAVILVVMVFLGSGWRMKNAEIGAVWSSTRGRSTRGHDAVVQYVSPSNCTLPAKWR